MKALSIRQPWAYLIMHHGKDIENRDWPTRLRGRIAIHASAKYDLNEGRRALLHIRSYGLASKRIEEFWFEDRSLIQTGSLLGTIEIVDCVTSSKSPWFVGKYGFILRNPQALASPIPMKGALGFWDLPKDLERAIVVELGDHL